MRLQTAALARIERRKDTFTPISLPMNVAASVSRDDICREAAADRGASAPYRVYRAGHDFVAGSIGYFYR
jgi:hypothetical protein